VLSILAAVLMQAAPAGAAPAAPPRPSVITQPDWLAKPTGADMSRFYPPAAAASRIEGRAVLHCRVAATGELTDCAVTGEDPPGAGFAQAALDLAPLFRMRPMTRDGVPVSGGRINIPIRFGLPALAPTGPLTLETALECYGATSVTKAKLINGEDAEIGWREAAQTLGQREHLSAPEVEGALSAAREMAGSLAGGPQAQLARCSAIRGSGAPRPLRTMPPPAGG